MDSVDIAVKYLRNSLFFTFLERQSWQIFFQYFLHADS